MDENWLHEKIAEISRTIYSYCRAKTPSQQDAEDLSQDILLELMKSVDNIRNDKAFYAFNFIKYLLMQPLKCFRIGVRIFVCFLHTIWR